MKKFVCLLMVAMLVLAMSVTAFARYEACPKCGGRMIEDVDTYTEYRQCPIDPSMKDKVKVTEYIFECSDCNYSENYTVDHEPQCKH